MDRKAAAAERNRLFDRFGQWQPPVDRREGGRPGGFGAVDRVVLADIAGADDLFDIGEPARPLPPPAFGYRREEGSRAYETVVSIPQYHRADYRVVIDQVHAEATGPVTVEEHANAVALGARIRRPVDDGEFVGTGCAYIHTVDGPQLLTCAHVLVDLIDQDQTVPIQILDPAGPSPMPATIGSLHVPDETLVNDLDAGLAHPSRTTGISPNRSTSVRTVAVQRGDWTAKWGAVTAETSATVEVPDLKGFGVEYPECVQLVRFSRLLRLHSPEPFAKEGDSGSLVWHEPSKEAIGMLVAGADEANRDGLWASYVLPMAGILKAFKATLQ